MRNTDNYLLIYEIVFFKFLDPKITFFTCNYESGILQISMTTFNCQFCGHKIIFVI